MSVNDEPGLGAQLSFALARGSRAKLGYRDCAWRARARRARARRDRTNTPGRSGTHSNPPLASIQATSASMLCFIGNYTRGAESLRE